MITTTTDGVEGRNVTSYMGIVSSEAVMGMNVFKDLFGSIRNIVGGRAGSYENELKEAKQLAIEGMAEEAQALGADAIIAVDLDYQFIGGDEKQMLMVCANGTAVKLG